MWPGVENGAGWQRVIPFFSFSFLLFFFFFCWHQKKSLFMREGFFFVLYVCPHIHFVRFYLLLFTQLKVFSVSLSFVPFLFHSCTPLSSLFFFFFFSHTRVISTFSLVCPWGAMFFLLVHRMKILRCGDFSFSFDWFLSGWIPGHRHHYKTIPQTPVLFFALFFWLDCSSSVDSIVISHNRPCGHFTGGTKNL